jgi:hypothetical protein
VVPAGVKTIGYAAFLYCKNLTTVILPDTLEEIVECAFLNCSALHTVNLPAGIKVLGSDVFGGCGELYNRSIPDSITAVTWEEHFGESQFAGCGKLKLATRQKLQAIGYTGDF